MEKPCYIPELSLLILLLMTGFLWDQDILFNLLMTFIDFFFFCLKSKSLLPDLMESVLLESSSILEHPESRRNLAKSLDLDEPFASGALKFFKRIF